MFSVWTSDDGAYRFVGLLPGPYTVREIQPPDLRFSVTPDEFMLDLAAGETRSVDFGDWNGRPVWLPLITQL